MHIAFLSVSSEFGGSEAVLCELVRGIRRLHADWPLSAVLPRDGVLAAKLQSAGADVHVLPVPPALLRLGESAQGTITRGASLVAAAAALRGFTRQLHAQLTSLAPDVIHSNGFKFHVLAARAKPSDTPLVWHIHEYIGRRPMTRTLLRRHRRAASLVVTNARSVAADVEKALGSDVPIKTIYNAVDLNVFSPAGSVADLDALAGVPAAAPGTVRVGLVATFGRWKGHEIFMRAVARLGTDRPIRAYIVGGSLYDTAGSQFTADELRALGRDLRLGDRLAFTGVLGEVAPALRALDVVVHASTQPEPFGLVIAEAMACGRAVIASAAGGAAEIVRPGVDALVHAPGDADGLAAALARAIDDPALRVRLGAAARESAAARFDAVRFAHDFDALYQSLGASAMAHL
jgi:glycosyltransferase involved in cell wall biosynthesis